MMTPLDRIFISAISVAKGGTMSSYSKNADAIAKLTPEQYRVTQQSSTEPSYR
jgi:hypothetical protein